jgi:hypothetical protein
MKEVPVEVSVLLGYRKMSLGAWCLTFGYKGVVLLARVEVSIDHYAVSKCRATIG